MASFPRSARRGPEGTFDPKEDLEEALRELLHPEEDEQAYQLRMLLDWQGPKYEGPETLPSEPTPGPSNEAPVAAAQTPMRPVTTEPFGKLTDLEDKPEPPESTFRLSLPTSSEAAPEDYRLRTPVGDPPEDPFERAALRTRRGVVGDRPIVEPDFYPGQEPPVEPTGTFGERLTATAERATRPERFAAKQILGVPGLLMYGIPAAFTELLAGIEEKTPTDDVPRSARRGKEGTFYAEESTTMRDAANYLKELATGSAKGIETVTGTEGIKPETALEHVGDWAGQYLFPYKRAATAIPAFTESLAGTVGPKIVAEGAKSFTVPLTTSAVAARGALTAFSPDDVSMIGSASAAERTGMDPGTANALGLGGSPTGPSVPVAPSGKAPTINAPITPGSTVIQTPAPDPTPRIDPSTGKMETKRQAKDRALKEFTDKPPEGIIVGPPDQRKTAEPNMKRRKKSRVKEGEDPWAETQEQFEQRKEMAWQAKEIKIRSYTDTAKRIFESAGGKQTVYETEYAAMGLAATAVGIAFAPKVYSKLLRGEVPASRAVARPVPNAAEGTMMVSDVRDVLRTQDDILAPLYNVATRSGMPVEAAEKLLQEHRIITRNGGRQLADSGLETGKIRTPSYDFTAPVPLNDVARKSTPESDQYLKLLAEKDDLLAARNEPIGRAVERQQLPKINPSTGKQQSVPSMGVYEARKTAENVRVGGRSQAELDAVISDMEKANPGLVEAGNAIRAHNKAKVDFAEAGEYGIMTKEEADASRMSRTNFLGKEKSVGALADDFKTVVAQRLDNEAIGRYVDEVRRLVPPSRELPEGGKSLFREVSEEEVKAHPEWTTKDRNVVVSFKRRGEMKYFTTDPFVADVLKADHHMVTGVGSNIIFGSKRMLEATTTGTFAPNFAVVNAIRSYWIAKFTTEQGFRAPTAIGSVLAIPQQLVPQVAKSLSRGLESGSQGMLGEMFGKEWMEGWAKRLAIHADESVYMQLKSAGSHRGSIIEQQQRALGFQEATEKINAFMSKVGADPAYRGVQHFWNAWKASLESVHNAVGFNFVKRNMGREGLPELALRSRRLTGDPRTGGTLYVGEGPGRRLINYESGGSAMDQAVATTLRVGYGYTMEAARQAIPWWNATLQGAKRIGEAWVNNPTRFARSTMLYAMGPAAGMFYYAKMLDMDDPTTGKKGGDPNGHSYLDYLLNGRSAYNRQMNFYIPIYGSPAEKGVELTFFHELNPFKRLMEISLHHMLGSDKAGEEARDFYHSYPDNISKRRTLREDLWIAAHMFLDTAVIPPMPPAASAVAGAYGVRLPQGIFGGEAYPIKGDPYNQNGGMPNSLEASTRAMMGGIAEAIGGFYAAASQAEEGTGVGPGLKQVRDIMIKKTPFLRDWTQILPDISNNTDIAKEAFEHQREYNALARFFKKWTVNSGAINTKPPSVGGGISAHEQYNLFEFNAGNPGLQQPQPTNPLYIQFMQQFYNRFSKESPNFVKGQDEGGVGFKSLWANYGDASQKLDRLKDINHGTYGRWQRNLNITDEEMNSLPTDEERKDAYLFRLAKYELDKEGVDTTDRQSVVNFYRKKQFEALRVINYVRRAVEQDFTNSEWNKQNNGGKPITFKSIKPFLEPEDEEGLGRGWASIGMQDILPQAFGR